MLRPFLALALLASVSFAALPAEAAPRGHCGLYGWWQLPADADCTRTGSDHCDVWLRAGNTCVSLSAVRSQGAPVLP